MRLLREVPIQNTTTPVNYVCYHPTQEKHLARGEYENPQCLAVYYDYESVLHEVINALGWRGGTIHQAVAEIIRLKKLEKGEAQ